jgi:gas vesicle protein
MSRREERERTEFLQRQQQDAINRSIDETKDNIRRTIEEVRRETPRYSQTVTDFQNETAEATREIADNFLDSQKEVINSMQSAWTPFAERTSSSGSGNNNYWMMGMMMQPWSWWMGMSPRDMVNIYARSISVMTDSVAASTRMATNMMFAGIEASRATTNYAKYSSKEIARITSNTARIFGQNTRETVSKMQEGSYGGTTTTTGTAATTTGRTTGTTEEKETDTARRK